eukprot:2862121-Rhodomonas_salina.1
MYSRSDARNQFCYGLFCACAKESLLSASTMRTQGRGEPVLLLAFFADDPERVDRIVVCFVGGINSTVSTVRVVRRTRQHLQMGRSKIREAAGRSLRLAIATPGCATHRQRNENGALVQHWLP